MRTVLKNAYYLDFSEQAGFVSRDILIEGDRIVQIEDRIDSSVGDICLDLKGCYVLPGLIDMHVHLCWDGSLDPVESLEHESRERTLLRMAYHARQTVLAGITTVRDLGAVDDLSIPLSTAVREGMILGPRIIPAGKSVIMTGGHDPFWGICVDGPWEAVKAVRMQADKGAQVVKISATGGVYGRKEGEEVGQSELTHDEIEAICLEAHRRGLRVASHALGEEGVRNSVLAGCNTIEHGIFASEEILQKMVEMGTFLTPTLFTYRNIAEGKGPAYAREKAKKVTEQHRWCFEKAKGKGVKLLAGSDAGSPEAPHPSLLLEMDEMVKRGLSPIEAIRVATLINAQGLGMENLIGAILEGKIADLCILRENPTRDLTALRKVWAVVKGGSFVRKDG